MNTFKKIKYFKLDSINPKDVEDYMRSFNSSFDENQDDINLIYRTLQTVAILCEQKCRALHGLGKSDTLAMVFQATYTDTSYFDFQILILVFTLSCVYTYEFRLSIDILEINKYPYFDSVLFQLLRS